MRRLSKFIVLIVLPITLITAGAGWWWQRHQLMDRLESWCAQQLHRISGDLFTPTLEFGSLNLELPATITLNDVSLTSDGVAIIKMTSLRLACRELPKKGHPFVIEEATFVDPQVRLIGKSDGKLQGFSGFMKSTTGRHYDDGGSSKPSDFLAIRHIAISNGMLEWLPIGYESPMRFEKLGMNLSTSPSADRPGWYDFKADIARPPIVDLSWDGGISIDTGDLAFNDVILNVDLTKDKYASLTPSIQRFLRQYSIVGTLDLHTTGHVPLQNAQATDLTFMATLRDSSAVIGDFQFPIESADMKATFKQMRFAFNPLFVNAFDGQIESNGSMGFEGDRAFSFNVTATDILVQDMCRPEAGQPAQYAGKVGLTLDVDGDTGGREAEATLKGTGKLKMSDGRLISVPIAGALADAIKANGQDLGGSDRADVEFTLARDRATIVKSMIQSAFVAGRLKGDIHYDGRLDMKANAGVVEKVQALLGDLGDVLGALTDRLLPYQISGTWSKPTVTPEPLGIRFGNSPGEHKDK